MAPTVDADAAAWIRDVVLTLTYRRSTGGILRCPCQGSASGHCQNGHHDQCPRTRGWHRHGQPDPETYVVSRSGGALTPVWRAGRACRWLCPCSCHQQVQALFPAPERGTGRTSTASYLRIGSTDRLRRDDDPQPTLLDILRAGEGVS